MDRVKDQVMVMAMETVTVTEMDTQAGEMVME
jgi:hypothetical protein